MHVSLLSRTPETEIWSMIGSPTELESAIFFVNPKNLEIRIWRTKKVKLKTKMKLQPDCVNHIYKSNAFFLSSFWQVLHDII